MRVTLWKLPFIRFTRMEFKPSKPSDRILKKLTHVPIPIVISYRPFPMLHSIRKLTLIPVTILIAHYSFTMKTIIKKFSFVNCSVGEIKCTLTWSFVLYPIAFVPITIGKVKNAKAIFVILSPVPFIFFSCRKVLQIPSSFPKIVHKLALIKVAINHKLFTLTIFLLIFEGSFINCSWRKEVESISVEKVLLKISHVNVTISTIQNALSLLNQSALSIFANVSCIVLILSVEDSLVIKSFVVSNVLLPEFLQQFLFSF